MSKKQKENLFFFSFSSESTFRYEKSTNKKQNNKIKNRHFCVFVKENGTFLCILHELVSILTDTWPNCRAVFVILQGSNNKKRWKKGQDKDNGNGKRRAN